MRIKYYIMDRGYIYLTNHFEADALQIAKLYSNR